MNYNTIFLVIRKCFKKHKYIFDSTSDFYFFYRMNTNTYQFNHRSHMRGKDPKKQPAFNFYEDKVIQGHLKKGGHYVPQAAKASEGDETKVF